jgi:hypothetical protein
MTPYGCHNHAERTESQPVTHSSGRTQWPFRFSTDCQYDRQRTDQQCDGCRWIKQGDEDGR